MESSLQAVGAYFDCRNQLWLDGGAKSLLPHLSDRSQSGLIENLSTTILRKRKNAEGTFPLLRAHTKIQVEEMPGRLTLPNPRVGEPGGRHYLIRERVVWVIQDGYQVRVEGRQMTHRQHWVNDLSGWKLAQAWESDETHPPTQPNQQAVEGMARDGQQSEALRQPSDSKPYDRLRALRYAELWWDDYNPAFPRFREDCTNFVSQCLLAGGMVIKKRASRAEGWWIDPDASPQSEKWSYSWSTTQALRLYIRSVGAKTVSGVETLRIGDLIFYDWEGTDRFHHAAIVVDFDDTGAPLINAHTDASYHRPYLYTDSLAWTPHTKYEFIHIPDDIVVN